MAAANKKKSAEKKEKKKERERPYSSITVRTALNKISQDNWSVYRASKHYGKPWKIGRPFTFTKEIETELVSYIVKMQELRFGLTVNQIRNLAYKLAASSGKPHPFSKDKEMGGWYWWGKFKERYGLGIRQPENLSMNRANMATRKVLDDFYSKLKTLAVKLGIDKSADRFWNTDETGLTYVTKSNTVVTLVGKKFKS
ncbi:Tc5 transposase DNA-binding domain [Popillia japonica]|uniref:Tc5 transposase DNA-binding domain n=1 Tax=Popillia japonica TaxID=7064 RepID=A0AAW1JGI3_POPJA